MEQFSKQQITDSTVTISPLLTNLLDKYQEYENDTINGLRGKTAQFYGIYINLVDNYLLLTRSVRSIDFDLFKYVLPKIAN